MVRPGVKNAEEEEGKEKREERKINNDMSNDNKELEQGEKLSNDSSASPRDEESNKAFISPRARNLLAKEAPSAIGVIGSGSGPGGRIIERDVKAILENSPPLTAAARAATDAASGTLPAVGTGMGGRVTAGDLVSQTPSSPLPNAALPQPDFPLPAPIKGIRKIIADRMHKSLAETAQFTLNSSAPVGRLLDMRSRFKNSAENSALSKITVNDLVLFAVSRVLPRFTYMNAHKIGDTVTAFQYVHLGFAVDTPRGLLVPVIRNADRLSLEQISAEVKRLAKACQEGSVKPGDISGSTFTVSNLGSLGVTSFTPILNTPEVAILGVCNIELKPVAQGESQSLIKHEHHIGFSLTINHQVVDGAPAARFLKALGEAVADIDLLLAGG